MELLWKKSFLIEILEISLRPKNDNPVETDLEKEQALSKLEIQMKEIGVYMVTENNFIQSKIRKPLSV